MNVNKHPKVALAWTHPSLEGVNDAEADQKRPVLSLSILPSLEVRFISWCNDAELAQKTERRTPSRREKETMNKHKQKHKKFMR